MHTSKLFIILLLLAAPAFGRIGEDADAIKKRYGRVGFEQPFKIMANGRTVEVGREVYFPAFEGWKVTCQLVNGTCEKIHFTKTGAWTDDQFRAILQANSQGFSWTITSKTNLELVRQWKRSDGGTAEWIGTSGLTVSSKKYLDAIAQIKKQTAAAAKAVPNF